MSNETMSQEDVLPALRMMETDWLPEHNPQDSSLLHVSRCPADHPNECGACYAARTFRAAVDAVAALIEREAALDSTLDRVLTETANELGCAPDNEAILQAIHDAKLREAALVAERDALAERVKGLEVQLTLVCTTIEGCGLGELPPELEASIYYSRGMIERAYSRKPEGVAP